MNDLGWVVKELRVFDEKNGVFQNLQKFVSAVVGGFGLELGIEIDRNKDLLLQVIRKHKNPAFDITKPLSVSFVDEPGLDGGGLTREYFHMLMQRLHKQCGTFDLLEGRNGNLLPIHNYDILSGGLFLLLGKMIMHAILNKCEGLCPAIIAYLVFGSRDAAVEQLTLDDFPDPVYQDKLHQVCLTQKTLNDAKQKDILIPASDNAEKSNLKKFPVYPCRTKILRL